MPSQLCNNLSKAIFVPRSLLFGKRSWSFLRTRIFIRANSALFSNPFPLLEAEKSAKGSSKAAPRACEGKLPSPPRHSRAVPLDGSAFAQNHQISGAKTSISSDTAIPLTAPLPSATIEGVLINTDLL